MVAGAAITNAKRKAVLSQLMMLGFVEKKSAAVLATGEKESHWIASILVIYFRASCILNLHPS